MLVDGLLIAHLTRGGRVLTTFFDGLPEPPETLVARLVEALESVSSTRFIVEKIDGDTALTSSLVEAFRIAGAGITPKGIRIGGRVGTARRAPDRDETDDAPLVRTRRRGGYPRARR